MTQILQGRPATIDNGSILKQLDNPADLRKNADVLSESSESLCDQADSLENEHKIQDKNKKTVVCHFYNEEFLLPWWLTHHNRIFDHGIMIDYQSTDRSVELIKEICPTWEIRPSKNEYFHAGLIDDEVMEIERELEGWRIALNVPEFLYGNIDQLNNYDEENKQFLIGNYVFVDMEDPEKGSATLDHSIPLHEQRYWGYVEDNYSGWQSSNGSTRRLNRSIHNYVIQYPDWGRHYPDTVPSFKDLVIFYYGWAYIGLEGIARKMQVKNKLPPGKFLGCHHDRDKSAMLRQYRDDQKPRATDLNEQLLPILEHNQYITTWKICNMTKYEYKYKEEHLKYIFEQQHEVQVAQDLDMYADLSVHEFSQFRSHIGTPKTVFEAGCGIGRGSVYLNHLLQDDEVEYILADRTGWHWQGEGNLLPGNDDVYNDLNMTADFSSINGIKKFRTFDTHVDDWNSLANVDLIFSLCSFGMHVSIEAYIDRLINISHPNTTMIFGTRSMNGITYGPTSFQDRFQQVVFIPGKPSPEGQEIAFPFEDWLILKNPIK
jgi:hypothetical protein